MNRNLKTIRHTPVQTTFCSAVATTLTLIFIWTFVSSTAGLHWPGSTAVQIAAPVVEQS